MVRIWISLWGFLLLASIGQAEALFVSCHEELQAEPISSRAVGCFYRSARESGRWEEATAELEALAQRFAEQEQGLLEAWTHFNLGRVFLDRGLDLAASSFRLAAEGFAVQSESEGEFYSWINLFLLAQREGEFHEADQHLQRAEQIAVQEQRRDWLGETKIQQARLIRRRGLDLARAERLLLEAEQQVFPEGSYSMQRNCLMELASVRYELNAWGEARRTYRALFELAEAAKDPYTQASALVGQAIVVHVLPRRQRGDILAITEQALVKAQSSGHTYAETLARMLLGRLLGGEEGAAHLEACRAQAAELGWLGSEALCLAHLARLQLDDHPARARQLLDEAIRKVGESTEPWEPVRFWEPRLDVLWKTASRDEAQTDAILLLDSIEVMREQQMSGMGRAGLLVNWADVYDSVIGRLLIDQDEQGIDTFELAFQVRERFRGRLLLDAKRRSLVSPNLPKTEPWLKQHQNIIGRLSEIQGRLLTQPLSSAERDTMLEELAATEREEEEVTSRLVALHPRFAARQQRFVELQALQESLSDRQAVLAFQLGPWKNPYEDFAGGSWLLVITREDRQAFRLPDPDEVEPLVELFLGLIEQRDQRAEKAANELYQAWFAEAMDSLPKTIDQLIILPDRLLHRVPLAMLRSETDAEPLGLRFEVTQAPSATLWQGWRRLEKPEFEHSALIFADPALPGSPESTEPVTRASTGAHLLASGVLPAALPYARREGRTIRRHLGRSSLLQVGEKASEKKLKLLDLSQFSIIHLAAHAVIDAQRPQRSAVLLAAGDAEQDGLLQPREIAELDLNQRVVVLSACQSASGKVLRGEGPMSLARAFFEAGTRVVIGGLWPLRDDEAEIFFDHFYTDLSRGQSVTQALQSAQRKMIADGHPPAAWAGIVVFGDGFFAPLPASRNLRLGFFLLFILFVAIVIGFVSWRRRAS